MEASYFVTKPTNPVDDHPGNILEGFSQSHVTILERCWSAVSGSFLYEPRLPLKSVITSMYDLCSRHYVRNVLCKIFLGQQTQALYFPVFPRAYGIDRDVSPDIALLLSVLSCLHGLFQYYNCIYYPLSFLNNQSLDIPQRSVPRGIDRDVSPDVALLLSVLSCIYGPFQCHNCISYPLSFLSNQSIDIPQRSVTRGIDRDVSPDIALLLSVLSCLHGSFQYHNCIYYPLSFLSKQSL
ncbi:hypothetical protein J6590_037206 [Homalodisca vitripennis]|nr:hypothetical protein J6590_037206 [Homalodisca vitripennis]